MLTSPIADKTAAVPELARRRPLTVFFAVVFGMGIPILSVPALAAHDVLPGGELPVPLFALAVTLLVMLPAAFWLTVLTEGTVGARDYVARIVRWRFGLHWWSLVLFAMPVGTVLAGMVLGGSLVTSDAASLYAQRLVFVLIACAVINLWEEAVWAGFVQRRLELDHGLGVAAALTGLGFAGIHVPLFLVGDLTVRGIVVDLVALLGFAVVFRLAAALIQVGTGGSILAVGLFHSVFNDSNNPGGLPDQMLSGVNQNYAAVLALTVLAGALTIHALVRERRFTPQSR